MLPSSLSTLDDYPTQLLRTSVPDGREFGRFEAYFR